MAGVISRSPGSVQLRVTLDLFIRGSEITKCAGMSCW
jgi:hypothetical protein